MFCFMEVYAINLRENCRQIHWEQLSNYTEVRSQPILYRNTWKCGFYLKEFVSHFNSCSGCRTFFRNPGDEDSLRTQQDDVPLYDRQPLFCFRYSDMTQLTSSSPLYGVDPFPPAMLIPRPPVCRRMVRVYCKSRYRKSTNTTKKGQKLHNLGQFRGRWTHNACLGFIIHFYHLTNLNIRFGLWVSSLILSQVGVHFSWAASYNHANRRMGMASQGCQKANVTSSGGFTYI